MTPAAVAALRMSANSAARGIEWAAETLARGLHDQPVGMFQFGEPSCATLTDGFTLLTGHDAPHACE